MSSSRKIAEFPAVEAKLQKPSKQSAFEKQRAEAEAKKAREAAETAAVLKEFEASFDDDGHSAGNSRFGASPGSGFQARGPGFGPASGPQGPPRRHFGGSTNMKSGPGSLGPIPNLKSGPGSLGPSPSSFGKKRAYDNFKQERDRNSRMEQEERLSVSRAFNHSDDEDESTATGAKDDERAVARPTMLLSQVPPGTSPATIKSWIPSHLNVEDVKVLPSSGPATDRRSIVAVVTLSQETPAADIDSAVSTLQNRYLGYGFYLSLHRHLSSAVSAFSAANAGANTSSGSQPFGAKPVALNPKPGRSAMQQGFHRGFAPPTSYAQNQGAPNRSNILHVPVKAPNDVRMLQLINKTIELLLAHGPEFEALLMGRTDVQREEKWAWLWDARSEGGIWYRWRLWEVVTGSASSEGKAKFLPLFEDSHAWKAPEKRLPFEYVTNVDDFVSDAEYNSSDEEDMDGEPNRDQAGKGESDEKTFLNPLDKAKLTHLLSRLPTTLTRIRKGDVARITAFALTHASRGADEVVDMIVSNIEKPLALTRANPEREQNIKKRDGVGASKDHTQEGTTAEEKAEKESADFSGARLVGLYVVSDILSASSTSNIRHAWRFRQVFESALKEHRIFETLGLMAEKHNWGRLRAEKWKRSVGMILNLWEGWCVFPAESQESFSSTFENPPSSKAQQELADEENLKKNKWKLVEVSTPDDAAATIATTQAEVDQTAEPVSKDDDVAGVPMDEDDVAGEPMDEDDVAREPMDEDDVDGEPMEEEDVEGEPIAEGDLSGDEGGQVTMQQQGTSVTGSGDRHQNAGAGGGMVSADAEQRQQQQQKQAGVAEGSDGGKGNHAAGPSFNVSSKAAGQVRKRMTAADMFGGDSDESDGGGR